MHTSRVILPVITPASNRRVKRVALGSGDDPRSHLCRWYARSEAPRDRLGLVVRLLPFALLFSCTAPGPPPRSPQLSTKPPVLDAEPSKDQPLRFEEPEVERTLLTALRPGSEAGPDRRPLRAEELLAWKEIELRRVSTLTDLEQLPALERVVVLELVGGDPSPLARMPRLRNVAIRSLGAADRGDGALAALRHAAGLQTLSLPGAGITTLAPVTSLPELRMLNLRSNRISDLEPLRGATHLEHLDLGENAVSSLGPLSQLKSLKSLDVSSNPIRSILALGSLTALETLDLRGTEVEDLRPLVGLLSLRSVAICGTPAETGDAWKKWNRAVVEALRARRTMVIFRASGWDSRWVSLVPRKTTR